MSSIRTIRHLISTIGRHFASSDDRPQPESASAPRPGRLFFRLHIFQVHTTLVKLERLRDLLVPVLENTSQAGELLFESFASPLRFKPRFFKD